jgi:hypothetical protein
MQRGVLIMPKNLPVAEQHKLRKRGYLPEEEAKREVINQILRAYKLAAPFSPSLKYVDAPKLFCDHLGSLVDVRRLFGGWCWVAAVFGWPCMYDWWDTRYVGRDYARKFAKKAYESAPKGALRLMWSEYYEAGGRTSRRYVVAWVLPPEGSEG